MDGIVLAMFEAIKASHAPAMVDSGIRNVNACRFAMACAQVAFGIRNVNACRFAMACAQVAFLAFLFIDFDAEQ